MVIICFVVESYFEYLYRIIKTFNLKTLLFKNTLIFPIFQFHACEIPEELASIPLVFEEPIYGNHQLTFTDFMAPGIILTIVHSMALGYSAMIIIMERNEGLLDRTWVAGVTPGEFALAHFLVSLVVNLLQVIVTLVFMIAVFQVSSPSSNLAKWPIFTKKNLKTCSA